MATTTNYGWTTPDDTALVKDGASAIRTLGTSVDTTTKNLNPSTTLGDVEYRSSTANTNTRLGIGTTGQVLTVSGGVPAWSTPASAAPGSATATVATNESTTSGSYTDLTTAGPAVTITTGTKVLVIITGFIRQFQANRISNMSFAISGATTTAATDAISLAMYEAQSNQSANQCSAVYRMTVTAGSNTFTAKYKTGAASGGAQFEHRSITVIDLGS